MRIAPTQFSVEADLTTGGHGKRTVPYLRIVVTCVAILGGAAGVLYWYWTLSQLRGAYLREDFSVYYETSLAARTGLDPYLLNLKEFSRSLGFVPPPAFEHPADSPALIVGMEPLTFFTPRTAYVIWQSASLVAFLAAAFLLLGRAFGVGWRLAVNMFFFAVLFTPVADNFLWGQSQTFLLLGLVIVMRLAQRGLDRSAGAVLAVLGLLRVFPLVIGGYLLVRRKWSALSAMAVTFAAGVALVIGLGGPALISDFVKIGGMRAAQESAHLPVNVSIDFFMQRTVGYFVGPAGSGSTALIGVAAYVFKIALVALTAWLTTGTADRDGRSFGLWTVTMLLLSPLVYLNYTMLLLLPFALIGLAAISGNTRPATVLLTVVSYALMSLATAIIMLPSPEQIGPWQFTFSNLGFLSLALAYLAACLFASDKDLRAIRAASPA